MKITKHISEKVTFKGANDTFHSREFSTGREISLPDGVPEELIRLEEAKLDYDLRKQVLVNFVLEGVLTGDQIKTRLEPYQQMVSKLQKSFDEIPELGG